MSELTTNMLNERLIKQADRELNSYLDKMLKEVANISERMKTTQEIEAHGFTLPRGTYIRQVLVAVNKAMFAALYETNRENYVNEWLKKVNETSDASKNLQGGPL